MPASGPITGRRRRHCDLSDLDHMLTSVARGVSYLPDFQPPALTCLNKSFCGRQGTLRLPERGGLQVLRHYCLPEAGLTRCLTGIGVEIVRGSLAHGETKFWDRHSTAFTRFPKWDWTPVHYSCVCFLFPGFLPHPFSTASPETLPDLLLLEFLSQWLLLGKPRLSHDDGQLITWLRRTWHSVPEEVVVLEYTTRTCPVKETLWKKGKPTEPTHKENLQLTAPPAPAFGHKTCLAWHAQREQTDLPSSCSGEENGRGPRGPRFSKSCTLCSPSSMISLSLGLPGTPLNLSHKAIAAEGYIHCLTGWTGAGLQGMCLVTFPLCSWSVHMRSDKSALTFVSQLWSPCPFPFVFIGF